LLGFKEASINVVPETATDSIRQYPVHPEKLSGKTTYHTVTDMPATFFFV
jgi:hypothetical protein